MLYLVYYMNKLNLSYKVERLKNAFFQPNLCLRSYSSVGKNVINYEKNSIDMNLWCDIIKM